MGTKQPSAEGILGKLFRFGRIRSADRPANSLAGQGDIDARAVVNDLQANFVLEGEIYWDAVALALDVPPVSSWKNKFGKEFTFDMLCDELVRRDPANSSCSGTHRLISLAILLAADAETKILSDECREHVRGHLASVAELLTREQLADGSWQNDWHYSFSGRERNPLLQNRTIASGICNRSSH